MNNYNIACMTIKGWKHFMGLNSYTVRPILLVVAINGYEILSLENFLKLYGGLCNKAAIINCIYCV